MKDLQKLQEQACERIQKDIKQLEDMWKEHDKQWLIDNSYEISSSRAIGWFFDNPETLDMYDELDEDILEEIINYEHGNFVSEFYDYYIGLDENYHNIQAYDSLVEMLCDFLGYDF